MILHRDLKSSNVLLDEHCHCKLADFGFAIVKEDSAASSGLTSEGTLAWMAPELFSTHPKFSVKSDIYAFGMIMWEVASRGIPYREAKSSVISLCVKNGEREYIPAGCPQGYAALVEKCWHQEIAERPLIDEVINQLIQIQKLLGLSNSQGPANCCWTHNRKSHDFFINYRFETEGTRSAASHTREPKGGMVQMVYDTLSVQIKKDLSQVYCFWDQKCLNYGQDWEEGFLHGLQTCSVIVLLLSSKVLQRMQQNMAAKKQDNVLVEYECAILMNKVAKTPIVPIFLAEICNDANGDDLYAPFDFGLLSSMPDTAHCRGTRAQAAVEKLSTSLAQSEQRFLSSVKGTIDIIFHMQGQKLPKRGEEESAIEDMVAVLMQVLEK